MVPVSSGHTQANATDIPVALDHVHQIICGRAWLPNCNVGIVDAVFTEDGLDLIMIYVRERNSVRDRNATLVFLADSDGWWFLVEPDPETFQLCLDDGFVAERLEHIEHDEDEVTCPRD